MFPLNEPPHPLNFSLGEDQLLFHEEGSLGPGAHCATIQELNNAQGSGQAPWGRRYASKGMVAAHRSPCGTRAGRSPCFRLAPLYLPR